MKAFENTEVIEVDLDRRGFTRHGQHINAKGKKLMAKNSGTHKTYIKMKINNDTIADIQLNLSHETWEQVFDGNDINEIFNSFLNTFLRIYYSSFPLIWVRNKMNQNSWITPGIITCCKCKRRKTFTQRDLNSYSQPSRTTLFSLGI